MDEVHRIIKMIFSMQFDCSNLHISESEDMATTSHKFDRTDTLILKNGVKKGIL
jgi:hypothetical protein